MLVESPGGEGEGQGKCCNGLSNLRRKLEHNAACARSHFILMHVEVDILTHCADDLKV